MHIPIYEFELHALARFSHKCLLATSASTTGRAWSHAFVSDLIGSGTFTLILAKLWYKTKTWRWRQVEGKHWNDRGQEQHKEKGDTRKESKHEEAEGEGKEGNEEQEQREETKHTKQKNNHT